MVPGAASKSVCASVCPWRFDGPIDFADFEKLAYAHVNKDLIQPVCTHNEQ